jgi:nucleoside-diphosphate-sugar epimerase
VPSRALVTGGTGRLGSAVAARLLVVDGGRLLQTGPAGGA